MTSEMTKLKERAIQLLEKSQLLMASVDFTVGLIGNDEIENDEDYKKSIIIINRLRIDYEELIRMEEEYEEIRVELNKLDGNKNILKKLDDMPPLDFSPD